MIEFEPLAPGAHRIVVYGEFVQEDAQRLIAFAREQDKEGGNILLDLVSLAGFSFSAVSEELVHLPTLLKYLYALDRIAVVSDEDWIRSAARLESALLPGVSYEVYDEDEMDAARAWVLGESDHPHGGAVRDLDVGDPSIVAFELVGRIDRAEAEETLAKVRQRLAPPECSRLMLVIRKWHGFDPDVAASNAVMSTKFDLMRDLDRYAVVGGPGWLRQTAQAMGALVRPDVRAFDLGKQDEALAWLRN